MKIFMHETGSPESPAILFLHASPLSSRMWMPQLEYLPEFHCLAPDLPGHGRSALIPFTMQDTVSQLAGLIRDSVPGKKAHIVGLSFGGVVAQALMTAAPDVVDHVILSGTGVRMSKLLAGINRLNEPIWRLLRPEQLSALVCMQFGIPARQRAMISEDFKVFTAATMSLVLQTFLVIEMPSATKSPTLVVVGKKETFYAKRAARILSRSIPGARGFYIPGCGHVWNLEAPELFARTVRACVTDSPLPREFLPIK